MKTSPANPPSDQASPWLLVYAFGLVFIQGLMINHIQVFMPVLKDAYGLGEEKLGQISSLAFGSMIPALFLSGYVTEWLRPKRSGILAVVLMGAGCLVMGTATSLVMVVVGLMVLQFGMHWILGVHGAVIAGYFPQSRQRLFFCAMAMLAVGAIVGPPAMGEALESVTADGAAADWGEVYVGIGVVLWTLLAVLLIVCGRRIAPLAARPKESVTADGAAADWGEVYVGIEDRGEPVTNEDQPSVAARAWDLLVSGVFNRPALYLLGLIVVFDNLAIVNILTWLGVMAADRFDAKPDAIGYLASTMAAGVLFGRIVMAAFLSGRVSDRKLLGYTYGTAMLVFVLIIFAPSMEVLYVLYFIMSFFMAAQSAATYAIAAEKLGERAAVGIPVVDGIGSFGSMAAPLIMGSLAAQIGLDHALWLIPPFGLMLTIISLGWEWFDKAPKEQPSVDASEESAA